MEKTPKLSAKCCEEITKHYQPEYFKKQTAQQTGFWAPINRLFAGFDTSHSNAELPRVILSGIAIAVASQIIGGLFSLASAAVTPVAVPLMVITVALAGASYNITNYRAKKLIKEDIDNGTLAARYNAEVLEPKAAALSSRISNICTHAGIKSSFNADKSAVKAESVKAPAANTAAKP